MVAGNDDSRINCRGKLKDAVVFVILAIVNRAGGRIEHRAAR